MDTGMAYTRTEIKNSMSFKVALLSAMFLSGNLSNNCFVLTTSLQ